MFRPRPSDDGNTSRQSAGHHTVATAARVAPLVAQAVCESRVIGLALLRLFSIDNEQVEPRLDVLLERRPIDRPTLFDRHFTVGPTRAGPQ
jgi:hypothetical protein